MALESVLKHKVLNGWPLFWLIAAPMSLLMVVKASGFDLDTADGVSSMIQYSVRWAVPFIYLVVAISALQALWPGVFPKWLKRNRSYIGLCFAVAMGWQGLFIFLMSNFHREYYFEEVFYLRDELEGSTGYIFLAAMVVTSFRFGRQFLDARQWKLLHTCGIYFLWAYAFSVYWWNLFYYGNPVPLDYLYYWAGFLAFALRIAAWGKQRRDCGAKAGMTPAPPALRLLGVVLIGTGLLYAAIGGYWQEQLTAALLAPGWSANLVLWLPFWPFEPFLSLFAVGFGTLLLTRSAEPAGLGVRA